MKILMMIPVYKRPEILKLCVERLNFPEYADVRVLFVMSPGDRYLQTNLKLVKGFRRFFWENEPLSEKKNAGLRYAMDWEWDYLIELGSDDVYSPKIWDYYKRPLEEGWGVFGINNAYIYDIINNEALFFEGYAVDHDDEPMPFGALRCIRRELVEESMPLWESKHGRPLNAGMDGASYLKLKMRGHKAKIIDVGRDPILCDIKTATNVTTFYQVNRMAVGSPVDVDWMKRSFDLMDGENDCVELITWDGFANRFFKLRQRVGGEDAFNTVNEMYRKNFGEKKYKNYGVLKNLISRRHGKV